MSEKYSMNELLAWIEKQCSLVDAEWGCASSCEDECKGPKDAIIARLQAADALISAVREESPLSVNVRKAIAEYEGKV